MGRSFGPKYFIHLYAPMLLVLGYKYILKMDIPKEWKTMYVNIDSSGKTCAVHHYYV